jgi:hypothetical protein
MREFAERMPEPRGALDFDAFPFQREWYSEEVDDAAEVVFAKAAQVGASAYGVRWALRQADQFGDVGVLVMPSDQHVFAFGDERVARSRRRRTCTIACQRRRRCAGSG